MQTNMDMEQMDTGIWWGMLREYIWNYNIITKKRIHLDNSILQIMSQISFQN